MEILDLVSPQIVSTIGWTIVHSLWQGIIISLLLAIILVFIEKNNSRLRSIISYFALIFLFTISIRTFIEVDKNQSEKIHFTTSVESIGTSDNLVESDETLINSSSSEDHSSLLSEYIFIIREFISTHLYYIVLLWFAGIMIFSMRLLGGIVYTQRLKRREIKIVNNYWNEKISTLSEKIGITQSVKLFESKFVKFPLTVGYFKPVILFPLGFISGIPNDQLEIILAHELAHIKRADYILNIFQSIIEVLFFFNPAVWWISNTIRREREFLCDDLAIETCGNSVTLAKALFYLQNSENSNSKIAMAIVGNKNSLMGRIKRMKQLNNKNRTLGATLSIFSILLMGIFLACSQVSSDIVKNGDPSLQSTKAVSVSYETSSEESSPYSFESPENIYASASEYDNSSSQYLAGFDFGINGYGTDDDNRTKITFHDNDIYWKAYFEDDKLVELYKDGEKVAEEDFSKYEKLITRKYEEFKEDMAQLDADMDQLKIDMADLKVDLSELKNIEINFNKEEFDLEMKEMKRELKKGLAEIENMDFDINVDIDFDELKDNLKNIEVDLSDLDVEMAKLDLELEDLKVELKILTNFIKELKNELIEDGYIMDEDEDFDLLLTKNKMIVNDKRVSDKIHHKYLDIYKEHYKKDLDEDFKITN